MTIYRIPVDPSVPDQRFSVDLDGESFNLRLRWNTTAAQWFLDILTAEDVMVQAGLALVSNFFIGARSADPRRPRGALMVHDTRRNPSGSITLDELGDVVDLIWIDPESIAAMVASS